MRILVNVLSTNNFDRWHSYDIAIIDLDQENSKKLSQYLNWYKLIEDSVPELDSMCFENKFCRFYDAIDILFKDPESQKSILPDEVVKHLNEHRWAQLPDNFEEDVSKRLNPYEARITVNITRDEFWWKAELLEDLCTLTTAAIKKDVLQRII